MDEIYGPPWISTGDVKPDPPFKEIDLSTDYAMVDVSDFWAQEFHVFEAVTDYKMEYGFIDQLPIWQRIWGNVRYNWPRRVRLALKALRGTLEVWDVE